ncbi:hypothetical protein KL86DPRO_10215 [uncultured delta proteobacterium]|uniref:Uncharacterized protein n=1 Tax=uncultured delta proteobacterium TaxID=34034 RepID=A0A212IWM6_9DELT|nr:hypothetical protein KL86DPRO_10215 [uncultured delta proteobacterium]
MRNNKGINSHRKDDAEIYEYLLFLLQIR